MSTEPSKLFLIFIIFFAVGIFAGSFFVSLGGVYFGFLFIFLGLIFLALRPVHQSLGVGGSFSEVGFFCKLALIFFAFGAGFFWYAYKVVPPDLSDFQTGKNISLEAVVVDEPDERENYTRLVVKPDESEADRAKILVYTNHYPEFKYGDKILLEGKLKKPSSFAKAPADAKALADRPEDKSNFDWEAYLAKDDIYFEMFYPQTQFIESGQGFWLKEKLFSLKQNLLQKISLVIPEPHSSLLGGLVFGAKQSMPPELLEDFRKTGIIHIVVLSGYNITIVADAIMRFFSFLPFYFGIGLGMFGIFCFALMTGASATVVRASLMAIFVLLARATGRVYEITIALFTAGFLMLIHNPKILRFDASFQLSFLATMALLWVAPVVEQKLKFLPKKFHVREFATATIATQIFVLPLLLYKMGLFSVVSVPVNILVLLFVPATMFFGFLTSVAGFVSHFLSIPFGWITYALLEYELKVVDIFANLPFSSFTISNFPLWLTVFIYIIYALVLFKIKSGRVFRLTRPVE